MRLDIRQQWVRPLLAALVVGLLATAAVGCQKTPKEKLRAATAAVLNEKPDKAEEQLKAVLEAEPDNVEAKRLMGKVHLLRENYAKAEEQLRGLWDAQGFGKEGAELSTEQKSQKGLLTDDLTQLYTAWAESMDAKESPDKYEEVLKKGLEIDPKKPRLNSMLVTFYENRAKKLVEQGKKLEAAAAYEKILELRTLPKKRDKAEERATNLRFEANKEQMLTYFNDEAKAKLEREDRYDAENKAILFTVEQDVDEVEDYLEEKKGKKIRLDARNKKMQPIIHQYTVGKKLVPALTDVVVEATGIPKESDFSKVQPPKGFEIVETDASRNEYSIKAKIPLDAVLKIGFEVKQQTEKAKKEGEDKKADDANKEGGAKAKADQADDKK